MQGYWQRPDHTAEAIDADGWLHTGDICTVDSDGYFFIVDRLKDLMIASGYKVLPREVEEVLFKHPKIADCAVAGVKNAARGDDTITAFVVVKPGETLTADEVKEFCQGELAPYKVPREVRFREELPKTLVGKALRRELVAEELKHERGVCMSELIVIAYPEEDRAEKVMSVMLSLQKDEFVSLADAVCVSKDKNEKVRLHQSQHKTGKGAAWGAAAGLIAGSIFLTPLFGAGVGALIGGVVGRKVDIGLPDDFVRQVSAQLKPQSSGAGAGGHQREQASALAPVAGTGWRGVIQHP